MRLPVAAVVTGLFLALGCGSGAELRQDVNDKVRQEAREKFVEACSRIGPDGKEVPRAACACVADEVLRTHTTKELVQFAANPQAKELAPIVETCVRRLAR